MRSRYDLMIDSEQRSVDGTFYKDIMTFKITKYRQTQPPQEYHITEKDIYRRDIWINNLYGIQYFDDILLWLNNIDYAYNMEIDQLIVVPIRIDIENFYIKNRY